MERDLHEYDSFAIQEDIKKITELARIYEQSYVGIPAAVGRNIRYFYGKKISLPSVVAKVYLTWDTKLFFC